MGNCLAQPVENHPSSVKLSSPPAVLAPTCKKPPSTHTISSSSTKDNIIGELEELEATTTSGKIVTPNLKVFSLAELKSATRNFRPDTMLGEGGFGRVFKGWIDEKTLAPSRVGVGMAVAVKKSNPDSEQGLKEWQDYNAKLSDFGLAKLGPINGNSHVSTRVVGTYGYAAPEYVASGHLYVNSDVYGFGVVLLEIITGLRVLDLTRTTGQLDLVDWAKPLLPDKRKPRKMMDSKIQGRYPINAAFQIAQLILQCLDSDPKNRPSMGQVLECFRTMQCHQDEQSRAFQRALATSVRRSSEQ
ncbi:putative serine/threonine-protein kinase PIX13 isoform X2 [Nicotiana tabacum]|uniref:Serine/threonine-protein kinase PIX13 isoform X2 n=1 Tax=Nicotiana tabacum TaxID=4097 RepID=A0AC58U950_TOBAC